MNIRNILLLASLAAFLSGCVVTHPTAPPRDHDYDDDVYYDYRNTPSYEGYYYVRIIFIHNVPYYVDDNRYIRPIPPHLHDHFRKYPYNTLRRPPVFSRDSEVRDGYPMSRIIYMDGTPYHVEDSRIAQPVPAKLQQRFRYPQENMGRPPQASGQHDNGRNNEPPAYGRERNQEEHAPNGRVREERSPETRNQPRERIAQPPFERRQRRDESSHAARAENKASPFPDQRRAPVHQEQPAAAPIIRERSRADAPQQAADDSNKKEKDKKDNGKKSRSGKDDEEQDKGRGNGSRSN